MTNHSCPSRSERGNGKDGSEMDLSASAIVHRMKERGKVLTAKPAVSGPRTPDGKTDGGMISGSHPAIVVLISGEAIFEYMSATDVDEEMLVLCPNLGW
jgi:hypothetical protein